MLNTGIYHSSLLEYFTKMTGMKKLKMINPKLGEGVGEEVMAIKFGKLKS